MECPFCKISESQKLLSFEHWFLIRDRHPVSRGHLLAIPKQHRVDYFALTEPEAAELFAVLQAAKGQILAEDSAVAGFNIGANCGEAAGQSVFHCHVHVIPRRHRDVASPRGGVRGVIPNKQNY